MEGSVNKGFTLKTSTTPSQSDAGESNENEVNSDQLSSKLHHPKKPLTKHFMSPTISAATKAAATVPRKKILAERNESSNFNDTHLQKTPNFDSTTSPIKPRFVRSSSSRLTPSQSFTSEADDDDEQNICAADSSLKPYDPLTSYTSPRPKFLRYNPSRLHPQNETNKEDLGFDARRRMCFDSQIAAAEERAIADALNSVVFSSQESPTKEEEVEIDNNEMEEEKDEEEEEIEEIGEERGWSLKEMLKFLLVIVALFFSTLYISSMNSPTPSPTVEALRGLKDGYYGIQNKVFEAVNLKIFEGPNDRGAETNPDAELEENRVEDDNRGLVEGAEALGEVVEVQNVQIQDLSVNESERNWEVFDQLVEVTEIAKCEDVFDNELESKVESFDHLVGEGLREINEGAFRDQEIEKTVEGSDELLEIETVEKFESFQDHQVVGEEVVEVEIERAEEINSNTLNEFGISQRENEEESNTVSPETDSKEAIIKPTKIESSPRYIIGVPMFFTIIASLGLVYWSSHKKTSAENSPQPTANPIAESSIAEKISSVPDVEQEKIKKIEFKAMRALIRSNEEEEEASKEFRHSHAPIVELLGELVIGEVSGSLRSCGVKNKLLEIEESNNSVSQEKKRSHIKASSVLEFSTADSPSYGSLTAGKKIAKKEEAKDGEVNTLIITPVRRSSRIRNRAVMSP